MEVPMPEADEMVLSVVIPARNEEANLEQLSTRSTCHREFDLEAWDEF